MRERFRTATADALLCLMVIALQAELWLTRSAGSSRTTVELTAFSAVCAIALIAMVWARAGARRARVIAANADRAREAAHIAELASLGAVVRAKHAAVADSVNEAIVEIVAAQQAIVRAAYPDDILVRLRAAEDNAHTSMEDLRRIGDELMSAGTGPIDESTPATTAGAAVVTVPSQSCGPEAISPYVMSASSAATDDQATMAASGS